MERWCVVAKIKKSDQVVLLMSVRAGLLAIVDGIEEYLDMKRTKDLRKIAKEFRLNENYVGVVENEASV